MTECSCLCALAGHHDVCQASAQDGLRSLGGFAAVTGSSVCRPCYEVTREVVLAGLVGAELPRRG